MINLYHPNIQKKSNKHKEAKTKTFFPLSTKGHYSFQENQFRCLRQEEIVTCNHPPHPLIRTGMNWKEDLIIFLYWQMVKGVEIG